ncbi:hypothetical protein I547_3213 [Mycobacterium kansasii 824]|nr:hypothetical protein I547_3213 [Mycobacterium kansasii 824]
MQLETSCSAAYFARVVANHSQLAARDPDEILAHTRKPGSDPGHWLRYCQSAIPGQQRRRRA